MAGLNNPFAAPTAPSMFDVTRRQDLAKKLAANDVYTPNSGFLGALGQALAGSGSAFQSTTAANESQQGSDQAKAALAKALSGGYAGVQADPAAYIEAAGSSFLPPGEASAANGYIGAQGQLAQQTAENAALMQRQKQQQQFDLNTPVPINPYSPGFYNRATGETTMVGGMDGGAPLGTTGNPAIDPTADGYSTKIVGNTGVTQATIDQAAQIYNATGKAPSIGRGPQGLFARNAVMNRGAEMMGGTGSIVQNAADVKASGSSLTDQTKYANNIERAFNTATDTFNALNTFMQQYGVNPSQFPDLNQLGNFLQSHGQDAPGIIAAYKAQLQTLRQEYSQVLAKGGQRSVETDREAAQLIPETLSPAQLAQVQAQIKIDSDNAISEAKNQVGKISTTIGGIGKPTTSTGSVDYKTKYGLQ